MKQWTSHLTTLVLKQGTLKGGFFVCAFNRLTPNIKEHNFLSCPHTFVFKSTGEKLLTYQENSPWVIIPLNIHYKGIKG